MAFIVVVVVVRNNCISLICWFACFPLFVVDLAFVRVLMLLACCKWAIDLLCVRICELSPEVTIPMTARVYTYIMNVNGYHVIFQFMLALHYGWSNEGGKKWRFNKLRKSTAGSKRSDEVGWIWAIEAGKRWHYDNINDCIHLIKHCQCNTVIIHTSICHSDSQSEWFNYTFHCLHAFNSISLSLHYGIWCVITMLTNTSLIPFVWQNVQNIANRIVKCENNRIFFISHWRLFHMDFGTMHFFW